VFSFYNTYPFANGTLRIERHILLEMISNSKCIARVYVGVFMHVSLYCTANIKIFCEQTRNQLTRDPLANALYLFLFLLECMQEVSFILYVYMYICMHACLYCVCCEQKGHILIYVYWFSWGHAVAYLIEALCYKPESRRFDF
jgi:hypothetical protein